MIIIDVDILFIIVFEIHCEWHFTFSMHIRLRASGDQARVKEDDKGIDVKSDHSPRRKHVIDCD